MELSMYYKNKNRWYRITCLFKKRNIRSKNMLQINTNLCNSIEYGTISRHIFF